MKKMFLALLTTLALSTYSFAQYDDEDEYEEDSPAAVEEDEDDEDEAPAKPAKAAKKEKKVEKKSKKSGDPTVGFGISLVTRELASLESGLIGSRFNVAIKLNPEMELSAIVGFLHHGETTVSAAGQEVGAGDNATALSIGVGFDYYIAKPVSLGGQFIYDSLGEDDSALEFNFVFGLHGEIAKNVVLSGNLGLDFAYFMSKDGEADVTRLDFGLAPSIKCTWYAF